MWVLTGLFVLALAGTLTSSVYSALALCAALYYRRESATFTAVTGTPASLSVVKPLHGEGPDLEQNLLTFYRQKHSEFELIFSARRLDDPALEVVRRLADLYPQATTRIIASGEPEWPNARAFSVNASIAEAEHPTLVITDSDVRVPEDFLQRVAAPLEDRSVGLVTCLYRGVSLGGFWTDLEGLGMSVELMSNVLIANMLKGMDFALGPATATTKERLRAIGGLAETGFYYADDFALGKLMHRSGMRVVLSPVVVEHVVPRTTFSGSFQHQVLWLKNNRFLRLREHTGVVLIFAMPFAILGCIQEVSVGRLLLAFAWLLWGCVSCVLRSVVVGWGIVADRAALTKCWLYPLRDLIGFATWIATWFGNEVSFRGEKYELLRGGKVRRLSSRP